MSKIDRSEITPEHLFLSRRKFIKGLCTAAAGAALSACGGAATESSTESAATDTAPAERTPAESGAQTDELGNEFTSLESINEYNNYYEFSISKHDVGFIARNFQTRPWQLEIGGLVSNPKTFDLDELLAFEQEERIYRMRCVEGWAMVIPWLGFSLSELLELVEPTPEARYVRFETLYDPEQMPGQKSVFWPWPYVEGLRLDEAMHDLTILATGVYGKPLLPQTGAPIRLVVPWKYGFKSIKSIVKIDLVEEMPTSFWMAQSPEEYGFYANVNPNVPHPRWSQATEQRIGKIGRVKTLMFNGYEQEVAHLYEGMDLKVWF